MGSLGLELGWTWDKIGRGWKTRSRTSRNYQEVWNLHSWNPCRFPRTCKVFSILIRRPSQQCRTCPQFHRIALSSFGMSRLWGEFIESDFISSISALWSWGFCQQRFGGVSDVFCSPFPRSKFDGCFSRSSRARIDDKRHFIGNYIHKGQSCCLAIPRTSKCFKYF